MSETLTHRGPDEGGLFVSDDAQIGLGFRRLRIVDLTANASQPMANEDGSIRVVFNGEIYNFRELRRTLATRHQFRSQSDTEVIVHLFEDLGPAAIEHLEGMFAIAVWDARQRRLILARDRAGKKPLFYVHTPQRLLFASEIKAFAAHPELRLEPDPDAMPSFFLHGYVPCPGTLYKGVRQVEPGSYLIVSAAGTVQRHTYWRLEYPAQAAASRSRKPFQNAVVRVRQLVESAVERRLVSDVPIGAFLSGGLDSSIVVGVMSRVMSSPVKTFSIGFEGDRAYDESAYARLVATHFGTEHTEFRVSPSAIDLVEKLVWSHDGPFGDASAIPTYIVSALTRQHVTVALSGDGGDELFAGYLRFAAGVAAEHIPLPIRRLLATALRRLPSPSNDRHPLARAQRFASALALPMHDRMTRWAAMFYVELNDLFNDDYQHAVRPLDRLGYIRDDLSHMASFSPLNQLLYANFRSYLLDDLLVKIDRCGMANSLEIRSPFLDRELTEYVAALPDALKLKRFQTKVILREAFKDLIPSSVVARAKMGFGVPLDAWFRNALREYVREMLLATDAHYPTYLRKELVEDLLKDHLAGKIQRGLQLWTLLTFEVWLRSLSGGRERRFDPLVRAHSHR